jgi:hypothetical protein
VEDVYLIAQELVILKEADGSSLSVQNDISQLREAGWHLNFIFSHQLLFKLQLNIQHRMAIVGVFDVSRQRVGYITSTNVT